jgi:circadian clock protein KaiC
MADSENYESTLLMKRVPTGVAGLDEILRGGLLQGGVYIVQGAPGSGKTILGNEVCFRHAAGGGRAAYVTLLAEMHTRMLQHLRSMSFFKEALIPEALYYISAFHTLESAGLKGLIDVLWREIKNRAVSLLVLDGLVAAQETAQSDREFKKFINEIQAHAGAYGCTVLLLTSSSLQTVSAEHTMVDGVIELEDRMFGMRTERALTVRKFRGTAFLRGRHAFQITGEGIHLFPRIEATSSRPPREDGCRGRLATGIAGLDELLGGGLPACSATGVMGPAGIGKTVLALHFLSQCCAQEPGLHFGFFESPEALKAKASSLGLAFGERIERGDVEMLCHQQCEHMLDELAYRLLAAVKRRKVRRLVIDGLGPLLACATYPDRLGRFLACLMNELGACGATSVLTLETPGLQDGSDRAFLPSGGIWALAENLVLMRFLEEGTGVRRQVSVAKVRDGGHDLGIREFQITERGLTLGTGAVSPGQSVAGEESVPGEAKSAGT